MLILNCIVTKTNPFPVFGAFISVRNYAARKGYREKARKKAVKAEVKKVGFIPHNKRNISSVKPTTSRRINDQSKPDATDNVYITKFYKLKVYNFSEAVKCHRETHHPTTFNIPNAPVNVIIELDMHAEKKNRFVEKFSRIVGIPHPYNHGEERQIVAFCKTPELQKLALDAGATLSGGSDLIKSVQVGDISMHDYQYAVAHPDILPELVSIRGLMKKNFPNPRTGTLVADIVKSISRLSSGIQYHAQRDTYEEDYGWIETCLGTLEMTDEQLEENFTELIKDVNSVRPKRAGPFITRCFLLSPPSKEKLKIPYEHYINEKSTSPDNDEAAEQSSDSEEEEKKVKSQSQAG